MTPDSDIASNSEIAMLQHALTREWAVLAEVHPVLDEIIGTFYVYEETQQPDILYAESKRLRILYNRAMNNIYDMQERLRILAALPGPPQTTDAENLKAATEEVIALCTTLNRERSVAGQADDVLGGTRVVQLYGTHTDDEYTRRRAVHERTVETIRDIRAHIRTHLQVLVAMPVASPLSDPPPSISHDGRTNKMLTKQEKEDSQKLEDAYTAFVIATSVKAKAAYATAKAAKSVDAAYAAYVTATDIAKDADAAYIASAAASAIAKAAEADVRAAIETAKIDFFGLVQHKETL